MYVRSFKSLFTNSSLHQPAEGKSNQSSFLLEAWEQRLHANPYTFALLITGLGMLLRFLVDPWLQDQMPYITFVLAVAVTGLFVGVRPALFATFLGAAIGYFCFVEPRYQWGFRGVSDAAAFAVYLAAALAVVALIRARTKAAEFAEQSLAERTEAQRGLADAQALLKAFMDHSPACTYLKDSDGRKVYVNETATRVLKQWFSSEGGGQLRSHEKEVLRIGRSMEFVEKIADGDEERYWLAVKFPFVDQAGRKFVGANLIDITDRVRMQEVLQKTQELAAAGQMASLIAHEINNPLAGATNSLFLLGTEPLTDNARRYLNMVEEQLGRVTHITRLTLNFYREHGPPSAVNVSAIVDDVVNTLMPAMTSKNIHVIRDHRGEATIVSREDRVRDLLLNLVSNSVEFGAQSVKIRVEPGRDWQDINRTGVRIIVSDDGRGIAPENRERIFNPFFTTKEQRGAGLGLWASKVFVLRNGGSIRIRSSTRPGMTGTSVSVFFPTVTVGGRGVASAKFQSNGNEGVA
jgi:signal transduction histidine kinase